MPESDGVLSHGIKGLLFFGGLEIGYNIGGQTLSSPQTTELRVAGAEGGGAAEGTLFKWVHMAAAKVLLFSTLVSIVARSPFPLLGGVVSIADTYASYHYAIRCGRRHSRGLTKLGGRARGAGAVAAPAGDTDSLLSPPYVVDRVAGAVRRR